MFPFDGVYVWLQEHAEVVWHMLIDLTQSTIEEQVTVHEVDTLLRLEGHGHLCVDIELRVII